MINKNSLNIILLIGTILFLVTCTSICNKQPKSDKAVNSEKPANIEIQKDIIKENRSIINAKVLGVIEIDEYRFYLKLKILESEAIEGYANFTSKGDEIKVYPNYVRKEGQKEIDYSIKPNNKLLLARKLTNGNLIIATVYKTNGSKGVWSLINWSQ